MAQIIVGLAQLERAMTAKRVRQTVTALRQAGQYAGGACPFGSMPDG